MRKKSLVTTLKSVKFENKCDKKATKIMNMRDPKLNPIFSLLRLNQIESQHAISDQQSNFNVNSYSHQHTINNKLNQGNKQ